jgi:hypothetical protein
VTEGRGVGGWDEGWVGEEVLPSPYTLLGAGEVKLGLEMGKRKGTFR